MIWDHDEFSRGNGKSRKICTLEIFIFIRKWKTQKFDILKQLYVFKITISRIFHSKVPSYEKMNDSKQIYSK